MDGMLGEVSYDIGTVLGVLLIGTLLILILHDAIQKKNAVQRNYPIIGRLRFVLEGNLQILRKYEAYANH